MGRVLFISVVLIISCTAFYIPGANPIAYKHGAGVQIHVNGLHSLDAVIPYDYYYAPFCRPEKTVYRHESIGEMLSGDNIQSSIYVLGMGEDEQCAAAFCPVKSFLNKEAMQTLESLIERGYRGHLVVDNLPAFNNRTRLFQGRCKDNRLDDQYAFLKGYALGVPKKCTGDSRTLINNHLHITLQYNRVDAKDGSYMLAVGDADVALASSVFEKRPKKKKVDPSKPDEDTFLVVGFTVEGFSFKWPMGNDGPVGCADGFDLHNNNVPALSTDDGGTMAWTYSVSWIEEPNIRWASRWDSYLHTSAADTNDRVHWMSIINTLLIVLSLSSTVFITLLRVIRKDLARYNAVFDALVSKEELKEQSIDESGWKVVHGDVFRAPRNARALTIFTASGFQVFVLSVVVLATAMAGFQSPSRRGSLMTTLLFLFVSCSFLNGYFAARMYRKLGAEKSWMLIFKTGFLLPGLVFIIFFANNSILKSAQSSGAVPVFTLLALMSMWLLVAVPLSILGAAFGYAVVPGVHVRKINAIPRPVDHESQPIYLRFHTLVLICGVVPFATLFLELRFILQSWWQGMVYYVFGFLGVVFVLWACTAALTAITVVYYRLAAENYHWWWIAFFVPTSGGLYAFAFFTYYFFVQLSITSGVATTIYFLYMFLVTTLYVLCGGFVGVATTWLFLNKIYSAVKIE